MKFIHLILTVAFVLAGPAIARAEKLPKRFSFQKEDALKEWKEKIFRGRVMYSVVVHNTDGYLTAYSQNTANIKLIVVESGSENVNRWVSEERNVYEDFKKAFGREPGEVGAVAIMTDTDNTASTAEADYDDIKVGYSYGKE